MECTGTWSGFVRWLGESDPYITVQPCSGCRELMVLFKGKRFDVPPGSTDQEILRAVLAPTQGEPN